MTQVMPLHWQDSMARKQRPQLATAPAQAPLWDVLFLHVLWTVLAANSLAIADGFAPSPVAIEVDQPTDSISAYDKGHKKCGFSQTTTTKAPSVRFNLARPISDLRITITSQAVVEKDDGSYFCVKNSTLWPKEWAAGEYGIYLYNLRQLKAKVTFEQPKRIEAQVPRAVAQTPQLQQGNLRENPLSASYTPPAIFERSTSGIHCAPGTMAPLARLKVKHESTWKFTSTRNLVLFNVSRNSCVPAGKRTKLGAGSYQLWLKNDLSGKPVEVAIEDKSAAMRFGAAPTFSLKPDASGRLLSIVSGKTTSGRGPIRVMMGTALKLPTAPSFYLNGNGAKNISLKMWHKEFSGLGMGYYVYGPMETATAETKLRYLDSLSFARVEGTYAVFVTSQQANSASFEGLVFTKGVETEQTVLPRAISSGLAVKERMLTDHYPFYRPGASVEWYFRNSPIELFVVSTEDVGDVQAGEPLLVIHRGQNVEVSRYDGSRHRIRAASLSGNVPLSSSLPAKPPKLEMASDVENALRLGGPSEDGIIEKYLAAERKLNGCVHKWMEKNDPTWGKSYELVNLRTGRTLSDQKFKRADRVCGLSKVERVGKRLIGKVNRSRKNNAKIYLAFLKKRFRSQGLGALE